MHGDKSLPLPFGPLRAQLVERHQWGAFLGSVGLHVLVLLSLPWLMQREPLPQPMEIEVQLEHESPLLAQVQRHASHARRHHAPRNVKTSRAPIARRQPVTSPLALREMQVEIRGVRKRKIRFGGHTIKLASSAMTARGSANQRGTAPKGAAKGLGRSAAPAAWQAHTLPSLPPRQAYVGRVASIAQASHPKTGEESSPGPTFLTGSTPAAQTLSPEYRHASRPGGTLASQGGAQRPAAGLDARAYEARQGGWQTASAGQAVAAMASPASRTGGSAALSRKETRTAGRPSDGGASGRGTEPGMALAASPIGAGSTATKVAAYGGGTGISPNSGAGSGGKVGSAVTPGEHWYGGLVGSSGTGAPVSTATLGAVRSEPDGSGGTMGAARQGSSEGGSGGFQLAAADGGPSPRGGPGRQHGQLADGDAPINASFESAESSKPAMQLAAVNAGSARLLEDRYTATSVKVASPTHFCQIPLMLAGLGGPIPKGLDNIMPSSSAMDGEFPPRHLPGNQMPVYPLGALGGNLYGIVTLRAEVLTNGRVGRVLLKQSSGARILDAAAQETVRQWRFQPAQRNGQPVVAWMTVPIEYRNPQTLNGANP